MNNDLKSLLVILNVFLLDGFDKNGQSVNVYYIVRVQTVDDRD